MTLKEQLSESWYEQLKDEFKLPYIARLQQFIKRERSLYRVNPTPDNVFRAYRLTPFDKVSTIIYGQDPYPDPKFANGLAFSSNEALEEVPKSLQNIFKELENDIGFNSVYHDPDLERWAKQGVFLLNRVLTCRAYRPNSHRKRGWEQFTDATLDKLYNRKDPLVFILWGRAAQSVMKDIPSHHHIITSPHPSPLSAYRGFFNSSPFSRCNTYLSKNNKQLINWTK